MQEILLEQEFNQLIKKFTNEHCMQFEATEENKLVYTEIFKKYTDTIENYLNQKLWNKQINEIFEVSKDQEGITRMTLNLP